MDQQPRTYTLDEIEELTGFDKRTIAYYVQEDVLPKVGRRGPRTRYPQLFLDRLLFIKRVRDLQDTGRIGTMTLVDFRDVFERLSAREIAELAAGDRPIGPIAHGAYEPRFAEPRMASAGRRAELMSERLEATSPAPEASRASVWLARNARFRLDEPTAEAAEPRLSDRLGRLLNDLEPSREGREDDRHRLPERWSRARVTPDITISARDLDEEGARRLEEIAHLLRLLMHGADRD